jgi:GTPase Era involved in 16S rRNA processing
MQQATKLNTGKDTALSHVFEDEVYSITSAFGNFYNHVAVKTFFFTSASYNMVYIDTPITSCPKHGVTETYLITSWFPKS